MVHRTWLLLLMPLLASCAAMRANTQGPTQPQSVSGPCTVKSFFLLGLRSVPAEMTVASANGPGDAPACVFTLINPALNAVVDAALLTGLPAHGTARADLIGGARQVAVSYTPQRGYVGPDKFNVTLEPGAVGVTVNVMVQAAR